MSILAEITKTSTSNVANVQCTQLLIGKVKSPNSKPSWFQKSCPKKSKELVDICCTMST